jgi:hypothetical protein
MEIDRVGDSSDNGHDVEIIEDENASAARETPMGTKRRAGDAGIDRVDDSSDNGHDVEIIEDENISAARGTPMRKQW